MIDMNTLFAVLFLLSPMVSKTPVPQDTLNDINLHFTIGATSGGNVTQPGFTAGGKIEYLITHPLVVRLSGDYGFSDIIGREFPNGTLKSTELAFEALAYRGRNEYFIYLGLGVVKSFSKFSPDQIDMFYFDNIEVDSLFESGNLVGIDMSGGWGYRFILGGRYREKYSLEFGFQETRPDFTFLITRPDRKFAEVFRESKVTTFWVKTGYLIPL